MLHPLLHHGDLPEGRTHMCDADLIGLWVAVAAICGIAGHHQHVRTGLGLFPSGGMHCLKVKNQITLSSLKE